MSKIAIAFYFCNIHFMQLYQFVESWSIFHQAAMVYWLARWTTDSTDPGLNPCSATSLFQLRMTNFSIICCQAYETGVHKQSLLGLAIGLSILAMAKQGECIVASSNMHYKFKNKKGHSTQPSKIPFIDNLKRPECASKQDVLKLAILRYVKIPM